MKYKHMKMEPIPNEDRNTRLLLNSLRTLRETEEVANETLETLTLQKSQIQNAKQNLIESTSALDTSLKKIKNLNSQCIIS